MSLNNGWLAGDKAVFDIEEEMQYCKQELKDEIESFEDIDEIYDAILINFPNLPLSKKEQELKQVIQDLLKYFLEDHYQLLPDKCRDISAQLP